MYTDEQGEKDGTGHGIVIGRGETTTTPGGFSAVAEPAGPVDPEAAKRAAEKYAQNTQSQNFKQWLVVTRNQMKQHR